MAAFPGAKLERCATRWRTNIACRRRLAADAGGDGPAEAGFAHDATCLTMMPDFAPPDAEPMDDMDMENEL